jgi:hypothetical protein
MPNRGVLSLIERRLTATVTVQLLPLRLLSKDQSLPQQDTSLIIKYSKRNKRINIKLQDPVSEVQRN